MKSIFEYLEYRDYLKDFYEHNKKKYLFFSYRYYGNQTGMHTGLLVKVLLQQMHIANKIIPQFIKFFNFNKKEAEYFKLLISYNKAKTKKEIRLSFKKLISSRSPFVKTLVAKQYDFFKEWYNIAIYELLTFHPYKGTIKDLALKLDPPITIGEAKKTINLLKKLKLIKKDSEGFLIVINNLITTGDSWVSNAIRGFQKKMIQLGADAIDRIPKDKRDISTVTVSLSKEQFEIIKERIRVMREELLEMANRDTQTEEVYQINFQAFPLTNVNRGIK